MWTDDMITDLPASERRALDADRRALNGAERAARELNRMGSLAPLTRSPRRAV